MEATKFEARVVFRESRKLISVTCHRCQELEPDGVKEPGGDVEDKTQNQESPINLGDHLPANIGICVF